MRLFSRLRGSRQSRLRSSTYLSLDWWYVSRERRITRVAPILGPAILSLVFGGNRDKDQNERFQSRPVAMSSEGQHRGRAAPVVVIFITILLAGAGQAAAQQGGNVSRFGPGINKNR